MAKRIAPPKHDSVEHSYVPVPNAPLVPTDQAAAAEIFVHARDSKRSFTIETAAMKVAKRSEGTSTSNASHCYLSLDDSEEDDDHWSLTDLLIRERRSKSRSDRHFSIQASDPVVQLPRSTDFTTQLASNVRDRPADRPSRAQLNFTVSRQMILTDSDSDRESTLANSVGLQSEVGAAPSTVDRDIPQVGAQVNSGVDDRMASGPAGSVPSVDPPTILTELSLPRVEPPTATEEAKLSRSSRKKKSKRKVIKKPRAVPNQGQSDSHPQRREDTTSLTSCPSGRRVRRADLNQHQAPFPSKAQFEPVAPSSLSRPSVDPHEMLHCMSAGRGYIGEGYWKDLKVASSYERICSVFNNGVYAVEELNRALKTQERQASEISRLKKELVKKNDLLKSAFASESKIKQSFEERLRQQEVIKDSLRRTLANTENKASAVAENLRELSLRNSQLEASTAKAELRSAELESRAILAEQEAIKSEGEAKITKETIAATQHLLLESQQKSEEAKLHYEKLVENLSQRQVSLEMLSQEAQLAREIQAVDRYKRSPAFDAFMLREQERGLSIARSFFGSKERATEDACQKWDRAIKRHKANSQEAINNQRIRWRAYCRSIGKEAHAMHLELPSVSSFVTYHADDKADPSSEMVDVGPLLDADYSPFMIDDPDEISWPDFGDLSKGYEDALPGTSGPGGPSSPSKG